MPRNDGNIQVRNAELRFRNFQGREDKFNAEGKRNFALKIDSEFADQLEADGWNVRRRPPREPGEEEFNTLSVAVNFKGRRPPNCVLITSKGRTTLPEELVGMLDLIDIEKVDLVIRPYHWEVGGNSGIKAYLKSIYVTAYEDELDREYAEIPEIGAPDTRELERAQDARALEAGKEIKTIQGTVLHDEDEELAF